MHLQLLKSAGFFARLMENKGWSVVVTVIATLLLFGVLIFIHELGHYIAARIFGVTIHEFAIGMGPKIISKTSRKTGITYSFRALPIGGYVSMAGEDEESSDPNAFSKKKVWQRVIITAAGVTMNILLGFLLTMIYVGTMPALYGTTVTQFPEGAYSASCEQPLTVGDEIVAVGSRRVYTGQEAIYEIFRAGSDKKKQNFDENGTPVSVSVDLTVRRNGEKIRLEGVVFPVETEKGQVFGLRDFYINALPKTLGNLTKFTFRQMGLSVRMVYESLFDLLTGRYGFEAISGPVGTAQVVKEAITQDATAPVGQSRNTFIYLAMILSVNLAVFNLLPIPALDGGRLVFLFIEWIFRRPVPKKYEAIVNFVGIVLLLGFMAAVTLKDVIGLFR